MLKCKVTKKEIIESYPSVIKLGYCSIQHLLNYNTPNYYTTGVYGWNADIFVVNDSTVIVTGYRSFGNIQPDYNITKEYEKAAEKLCYDYNIKYEEKQNAITELLYEYVKEVTK